MLAVSKNTLRIVAGTVWLTGGIILLLKSASLFAQAVEIRPGEVASWFAVAVALLLGAAKAYYLFRGFCRKNLDRIAALTEPQLWQAFRPGFYAFMATMVLLATTLSTLATGNYAALLAMFTLDVSIAIALLGSFPVFWQHPSRTAIWSLWALAAMVLVDIGIVIAVLGSVGVFSGGS